MVRNSKTKRNWKEYVINFFIRDKSIFRFVPQQLITIFLRIIYEFIRVTKHYTIVLVFKLYNIRIIAPLINASIFTRVFNHLSFQERKIRLVLLNHVPLSHPYLLTRYFYWKKYKRYVISRLISLRLLWECSNLTFYY